MKCARAWGPCASFGGSSGLLPRFRAPSPVRSPPPLRPGLLPPIRVPLAPGPSAAEFCRAGAELPTAG
eukprot:8633712-Alexandrium_andersonii.AAC.1